jgi:hypothetical protein
VAQDQRGDPGSSTEVPGMWWVMWKLQASLLLNYLAIISRFSFAFEIISWQKYQFTDLFQAELQIH